MATIFPREERAEALFGEILKNPEACRRLMDTFNDSLDMADVLDAPTVSAQQFAAALFNAYENKDLSAFLMAICQHSMFDLLRNAALIPFKFNADGQPNPVILTDDAGVLLPNNKFAVSSKVYDRFIRVFQKQEKVKMYLASGYCKYHGYELWRRIRFLTDVQQPPESGGLCSPHRCRDEHIPAGTGQPCRVPARCGCVSGCAAGRSAGILPEECRRLSPYLGHGSFHRHYGSGAVFLPCHLQSGHHVFDRLSHMVCKCHPYHRVTSAGSDFCPYHHR
jgi:hypothetical protein